MIAIAQNLISDIKKVLCRSAVQHVGALTISQYLAAALGFITTLIAARILGPEGYGQAALILAFPSLLLSVGSFKSITVSTRYLAGLRATGKADQLKAMSKLGYAIDLGAFLVVFIIIVMTGRWVAEYFYTAPWMFRMMVLYAASFPMLAFKGTSFAVLTAFEKFRTLSILYVVERGITFILVVALLLAGYGVTGLVMGMAISNVLIGLISLGVVSSLFIRNGLGVWWKGSLKNIGYLRGELFSFFGWNYLVTTLSGAIIQVPIMLLGAVRGADEAGFFRLAVTLMTASSYPVSASGRVVYPSLSARWANGEPEVSLRRSLKEWTSRNGLLLALAVIGLIPILPLVVAPIFGEAYRPMVPGAQVLILAAAVSACFFWLNPYYYASGRVAAWTKGFALYTFVALSLGWLFIYWSGFLGIAVTLGISKIIFHLMMAWKAMNGRLEASKDSA